MCEYSQTVVEDGIEASPLGSQNTTSTRCPASSLSDSMDEIARPDTGDNTNWGNNLASSTSQNSSQPENARTQGASDKTPVLDSAVDEDQRDLDEDAAWGREYNSTHPLNSSPSPTTSEPDRETQDHDPQDPHMDDSAGLPSDDTADEDAWVDVDSSDKESNEHSSSPDSGGSDATIRPTADPFRIEVVDQATPRIEAQEGMILEELWLSSPAMVLPTWCLAPHRACLVELRQAHLHARHERQVLFKGTPEGHLRRARRKVREEHREKLCNTDPYLHRLEAEDAAFLYLPDPEDDWE